MVGFPLTVVLNCGRRGGRSVRIKNKTAVFLKLEAELTIAVVVSLSM